MTSQNRRAEPSPEARELLAHHDRLDLAEMVVALHQLEEAARTELAAFHAGEEPVTNPAVMHTPAQWIWQWNRATPEKRLQVAEAAMRDGAAAHDCRINGHTERIHDGRHAEMALNEVRNVVADMAAQGALQWAGWLRDAMKRGPEHCLLCAVETKPEPAPAATEATEPHTGLVVQPYTENGVQKWVFRCWGTDDGCDGWLSLDHYNEQSATRARDRHVTEEHS
ncbi:hypothetical protein ACFXKC_18015 [Streptomyces sp. NPDC059340]|uniref:hypothetical protein n=1 Tax=Streptomyces sp. NPDC059340 TaxID=3346806 RepID=UPI003687C590